MLQEYDDTLDTAPQHLVLAAAVAGDPHEPRRERAERFVERFEAGGQQIVRWAERRFRVGWRWLRTSNRYTLLLPEGPVTPRPRTNQHCADGGERDQKK